MGAAVRITRDEHTPAELRAFAAKALDAAQARRLLAIALVLDGVPLQSLVQIREEWVVVQRSAAQAAIWNSSAMKMA